MDLSMAAFSTARAGAAGNSAIANSTTTHRLRRMMTFPPLMAANRYLSAYPMAQGMPEGSGSSAGQARGAEQEVVAVARQPAGQLQRRAAGQRQEAEPRPHLVLAGGQPARALGGRVGEQLRLPPGRQQRGQLHPQQAQRQPPGIEPPD